MAAVSDVSVVKDIADAHRNELGFTPRVVFEQAVDRSELWLVVTADGVAGFAHVYVRKDRIATLRELAVSDKRCGLGRRMLLSIELRLRGVADSVRLKCPEDGPLGFYAACGYDEVGQEDGKRRRLHVFEKRLGVPVIVSYNTRVVRMAIRCGAYPGACVERVGDFNALPLAMLDTADWANPDIDSWRTAVAAHRPWSAVVPDVTVSSQLRDRLELAAFAEQHGANPILVPKVDCIDDIPEPTILGYAVPTTHGGNELPICRYGGRRVHLLGGNPRQQVEHATHLQAVGATVVSVDGNAWTRGAEFGCYWERRGGSLAYVERREPGIYHWCLEQSCQAKVEHWRDVEESA
jgi:hypothetical protein